MKECTQFVVLIPECGGPAGVSAIKAIRKLKDIKHLKIIGYDLDPFCAASMLVDEFLISPPAKDSTFDIFIKERLLNCDLVIPTSENDITILSSYKKDFPQQLAFISSIDVIETCLDKYETFKKLQDFDFVPRTELYRFSDIVFAKPRRGKGSVGCVLLTEGTNFVENQPMIYQEYLPGQETTVDCFFDLEGRLKSCVARERTKTRGGISTCATFVEPGRFKDIIESIATKLFFVGPQCIQFKNSHDGLPMLMEINPRLAGGYGMTLALGINFLEFMIKNDYSNCSKINLSNRVVVSRIFEEVLVAS